MNIISTDDILTKDDQESFELSTFNGRDAPASYHINYKNYGYAKFIIDDKSLSVFEEKLGLIKDNIARN